MTSASGPDRESKNATGSSIEHTSEPGRAVGIAECRHMARWLTIQRGRITSQKEQDLDSSSEWCEWE